uniref:PWWP domain-containing protein n=1 Tax=Cuerna arida TaxID=1464854 RepID=A0A1B6H3W2_9HEMI
MTFMVGNVVFAKIRGNSQWPAAIMSIDVKCGRKEFKLKLFGTNQTAYCTISCLSSFEETKQILMNKSSIKQSLKDAITEAESTMNQSTCTVSSRLDSKEGDFTVSIHCPL